MIVAARPIAWLALFLLAAGLGSSIVSADDGSDCQPRWHSQDWWARKAQEPVGSRQVEHDGKLWPPYPRPCGPEQASCHVYHAEHYWPWPYNCTDRQVVLDMTHIQEANGWLSETTLYDYHFNPDTNELTVPGKLHLKWILQYVPVSYRTVWLQQTEDTAIDKTRLSAVRNMAIRLVGENNIPPIAPRMATAPQRPAIEVDTIRRKELESIPEPRIPFEASASGSSSTQTGGQGH